MPSAAVPPTRTLTAQAPTRVDFAGGTLDLWPLYLFFPGARTLNAAIDLVSRVCLEAIPGGYEIISKDQQRRVRVRRLEDLRACTELPLLTALVLHFAPDEGLRVITENRSPAGSGLGGSSSLAIALAAALAEWTGSTLGISELMERVGNLETQVLRTPTGVQDYYAAAYGGASLLSFGPEGVRRQALSDCSSWLGPRLVLCYTGAPHHSGLSNWQVYRRAVDRDPVTCEALEQIVAAAERMEAALRACVPEQVADALEREWEARKRLSPQVSTARIEEVMDVARRNGALAGKVCGAGGGGCVLLIAREGGAREVARALGERGLEVLPFRLASRGLQWRWETADP
ncbi:MAG: GHMP kinase [Acidobacteriota bacterium]